MADKQHPQFSDENGNLFYLENGTEDVLHASGTPLSNGGDLSEASVKFTTDSTRKLPISGGRFKAFCGSVVKFLSDIKTVGFTGSYNDLSNKPSIPSGAAASQAVANNCTTTAAGSVLDARQGKVLMDKANQLSSDITEIGLSTTASSGNFSNTSIAPNVLTELTGYVNYSGNVLVDVNVFGWMAKNDGVYIEIVNEYSTIKQADYVASKEGRNDFHVILFSSTPSITIKVKHDSTSSRTFGATTNAIRI